MKTTFAIRSRVRQLLRQACRPRRLCGYLYVAAAVAYVKHSLVLSAIYIGLAVIHLVEKAPKHD